MQLLQIWIEHKKIYKWCKFHVLLYSSKSLKKRKNGYCTTPCQKISPCNNRVTSDTWLLTNIVFELRCFWRYSPVKNILYLEIRGYCRYLFFFNIKPILSYSVIDCWSVNSHETYREILCYCMQFLWNKKVINHVSLVMFLVLLSFHLQ